MPQHSCIIVTVLLDLVRLPSRQGFFVLVMATMVMKFIILIIFLILHLGGEKRTHFLSPPWQNDPITLEIMYKFFRKGRYNN
jgi:hypothetical protein